MEYKKPETKAKHDKLRKELLEIIANKESKYARTLDKKLGREIELSYKQLETYDEVFIYG